MQETSKTFEQQVLERLDRIDADITGLKTEVTQIKTNMAQNEKWQDRTWDVVKWVGGIALALATSAAIAYVGLLIRLTL